jgi:hypothetical protein
MIDVGLSVSVHTAAMISSESFLKDSPDGKAAG